MIPISVIIVAKNEESVIGACLDSVQHLSDDILVCDTGSTDNTKKIAEAKRAKVFTLKWEGYGATKNTAHQFAKYDWILQLDADETIDSILISALNKIDWSNKNKAYRVKRNGFFLGKLMRFGAWNGEKKVRIYNRNNAYWSNDLVHETLLLKNVHIVDAEGRILEKNYMTLREFDAKMQRYAILCAEKYYHQQRKGAQWKKFISPLYTFLLNYFIRIGFMDGIYGLKHALIISKYIYKKYSTLQSLQKQ